MDRFLSEPSEKNPEISLDSVTGKMKISGNCLCDYPRIFFASAFNWLEIHLPAFPEPIILELDLKSVSSGGFLEIVRMVKLIEKLCFPRREIEVFWRYADKDMEMKEKGFMLNEMTQLEVKVE